MFVVFTITFLLFLSQTLLSHNVAYECPLALPILNHPSFIPVVSHLYVSKVSRYWIERQVRLTDKLTVKVKL